MQGHPVENLQNKWLRNYPLLPPLTNSRSPEIYTCHLWQRLLCVKDAPEYQNIQLYCSPSTSHTMSVTNSLIGPSPSGSRIIKYIAMVIEVSAFFT